MFAGSRRYAVLFRTLPVILVLCFSLCANSIRADPQSQSYSSWKQLGSTVQVRYTIAKREVSRLFGQQNVSENDLPKLLLAHLQQSIALSIAGSQCSQSESVRQRASSAAYLVAELRFDCAAIRTLEDQDAAMTVRISAFFDAAPSHIHFARFAVAGDRKVERLFTRQTPQRQLGFSEENGSDSLQAVEGTGKTIRAYVTLGFQHILEGLDHIAFLLALLLLSTRLRDVVFIVTGFTLGHTVTLSLAVLDIVQPNIAFVESVIGLTIALVAIENIAVRSPYRFLIIACVAVALLIATLPTTLAWPVRGPPASAIFGLALFSVCYLLLSDSETTARRLRPLVTLVFGLVHGFGFANVLQEVGLPDDRVLAALFGFNIGVELGQLAIVFGLWLLLVVTSGVFSAGKMPMQGKPFQGNALQGKMLLPIDFLSASLCCLGTYWFVQRAFY